MDANRFDAIAHAFSVGTPRRTALGFLGAGFATVLAQFGIEVAEAKNKQTKKSCKHGKQRCGKKCIPKAYCC